MDSIISVLLSVFLSLALLVLMTKVIPRGVTICLVVLWLFCMVHPRLRQQILSIALPPMGAILPLLLIILGLRIMIRGKVR